MKFEPKNYPTESGIYIMKDKDETVIYVGKAINLRSRLSSYFNNPDRLKTRLLVTNINSIDFVITKTENEALILESNMIKTYQPKYNMVLKDSRHYSYLAISDEKFPRLLVARKNSKGKFRVRAQKYYGPFVDGTKRAISSRYLRKLFKIRICKKLPKKECLQYHLGNCDAPCIGKVTESQYMQNVDTLCSILDGKNYTRNLISYLEVRMKEASVKEDYETALSLRDQVDSLKIFFDRQNVEKIRSTTEDYLYFSHFENKLFVQILKMNNGVLNKNEKYNAEINSQEDPELSFVLQYYAANLPDKIYSNLTEQNNLKLNQIFSKNCFYNPSGDKAKILDMAAKTLHYSQVDESVMALKEALKLENLPIVIETFDISTLFGTNTVGSMVQFKNGKPNKSEYRRFEIKTIIGQDDFSSMNEIVSRRYSRLFQEKAQFPDLIVIDGGAGQLHAAMSALDKLALAIPIVSLAKREEEIYSPGRMHPLRLPKSNKGLKLLQKGRDEAHRFAITYHRLKRGKKLSTE